jgi:hypothetical protein
LCDGESITLSATAGSSFLWSNGETTQSITVSQPNSYTCEVTNYCGVSTSLPFVVNNVIPNLPVPIGDTVCISGSVVLNATSTGEVSWYDENYILVGTGNSYTTPVLTSSATYYAQNTDSYLDSVHAEPYTNGIGGGGYVTSEQYEVFNSYTNFTLESVLLYSQAAGNVTIQLQDENATVLATTTVAVPAGSSRATLNFDVPADSNLRLVGKNITTTGLYRNNNSATYPYELPDILSIVGASAGASYFYYFYDWKILTSNSTCESGLVPVDAVVLSCASIGENIPFKKSIKIAPNPNSGKFNVEFETSYSGSLKAEILNLVGQVVYSEEINHSIGSNTWQMNQSNLSKGVYLFNIFFEGKNYTTRMIID